MSTLDFSKMAGGPPGESFEALVRLIGERLGMIVQWSGRGADRGRDLIFVETQCRPINNSRVRWLVSCKDNSQSNQSVYERDVGSVLDKARQHECDGFLLATTTTASAGLKEMLDALGNDQSNSIQTKVWDRFEITGILLSDKCADLLTQFFPDHQRYTTIAKLDAAREVVEASLPRFVAGMVRERLVPDDQRMAHLGGNKVWPHDAEQRILIDEIRTLVFRRHGMKRAVQTAEKLEFDAFMRLADALIRNFPRQATKFLKAVGRSSRDGGVILNVIEMLREKNDFTLEEELEITRKCDRDTLFELYHEIASDKLHDASTWDDRLPGEIQRFADEIEIIDIDLDEMDITGGDGVSVSARISMKVRGSWFDPEEPSSEERFSFNAEGYFDDDGLVIDSIK